MKDQDGFYQGEQRDTLPDPGAKTRANGDLKGQEMRSTHDGAGRAVIYLRVASASEGDAAATARQEAACRELAEQLGLNIVGVYSDIGTKDRYQVRRMCDELPATNVKHVLTLDPSRFGRGHSNAMTVRTRLTAAGVAPVFAEWAGR